jgi:hypothetical protein
MRISHADMIDQAALMAERFSTIVQQTGTLTEEQMREAFRVAHRNHETGVRRIVSGKTLLAINEAYVEGVQQGRYL